MNLDAPEEILSQVVNMQLAMQPNARNRALICRLFNGELVESQEEAQEENVRTRVNWLQGTRVASNAVSQINNAFFKGDRFFTVHVDKGPVRLRPAIGALLTKTINKQLKRSREYRSARESAHAQVVLHGPGPMPWRDRRTCIPSVGGIEDVLVPAGTLCDMSNLDRFAIYREMTWPELWKQSQGKVVDPGWNQPYAKSLLATMYNMGFVPLYQGNRWLFPEKLAEDYKEGANWSAASALPKVLAWDFFYRDEDNGKWNRKLIVDYANMSSIKATDAVQKHQEVLYSKDGWADDWQEILHWYVGNCSNVAPYRYHSIRSIGYLLFGSCLLLNKLMNRNFDHMFMQLLTWFRNVSDDNREKLGLIDLQNFGVLPDGVSLVQASERYCVDPRYIQMGIEQATQMIAQSAMSFVPDMEGATKDKMMTATETLVRQNQSITLTSAVLGQLGDQSMYEYREICRRFCIKGNPDPMAKALREALKEHSIPEDYLDVDSWEVVPEMTVGAGNKASELMVTQALVQEVYPVADPDGQRLIMRRRYTALTDNPDEAAAIFPEVPKAGGNDVQQAQVAYSTMMGLQQPVAIEGISHVVQAQVWLQMAAVDLQQAEVVMGQPDGVGIAAQKLAGVSNVLAHAQQEIQKVAQADALREQAKNLTRMFAQVQGQLMQLGKALQALQEKQAQQEPSGEQAKLAAKLQDMQATGEMQRQLAAAKEAQKLEHKQIQWSEENARRNADTQAEIQRSNAKTVTELRNSTIKASADAQLAIMKESKKPTPASGA